MPGGPLLCFPAVLDHLGLQLLGFIQLFAAFGVYENTF